MMAIDQRGSMEKAIQSATGEEATYEQVAKMKTMITKILSPNSTAVLTDPIFGYPYSVMDVPRDVGLLLAFEESGYGRRWCWRKRTSLSSDRQLEH